MDRIILSPEDRRYAKEFRASPFGPHSPRLQQIVNVFRAGPANGKFVLIATSPHREWALGRLTGERACLVEVFEDCTFTSLVEAEWEVFKLRWVANRGPALDGETLLEPGEAVPARPPITLIGYADRITVRPGETIQFMVSSDTGAGYEAEIVRLICGDVNPQGPGYKEERVKTSVSGRYRGRRQEISAGSHVVVPGSPALTSLSVAAMIWPTLPGDGVPQSLLANFSDEERRGFVLRLDEAGAVALSVGDGRRVETVSTALPVRAREWAWVGASFDGASGRAVVFQRGLRRYPQIETEGRAERTLAVRIGPGAAPVTLAAHVREGVGEEAVMAGHYNGKIDSPRLAKAALSGEDIERLQHEPLALGDDLLAAWDFGREIPTTRVLDVGPNALHGRTVNLPARAMKGWNWSGREMSWRHASAEYGAIHFHDDDLYDARWEADFELVVPAEMRSGLYAARLKQGASEDYIPFYVRPARGAHRADILFLERVRHRQNQKGDSQGSQKVIQAMSWVKGGQPWMTRPYSEDLRERVVRVVESGTSRNAAAKQFDVSISFVVKLMQRWKQRGTIKADKYGGWKKSKLAPHGDRIRALVMENCDITIDELCVLLAAEGIEAKRSTLGDFLLAQGLSRKKRQPTPPSRSALTSRRREPLGATSNLG